jgi:two-component system LytT family response regulator
MIKCICIDDEPLALEMMEEFIKKVPFLQLIATCSHAMQAHELLEQHTLI